MNQTTTTSAGSFPQNAETAEILSEIDRYQSIQKMCPPSSDNWQDASMALKELFDEMARRTA